MGSQPLLNLACRACLAIEVIAKRALISKTRMARSCPNFFLAMLALLAGTGCDASLDPIQVADGCPGRPLRGPLAYVGEPSIQLIADFEKDTDALANVDGRSGSWVVGSDGSSSEKPIAERSGQCAGRGSYAGHFAGRGFTRWGANWTAVFEPTSGGSPVPYDASKYSGVSFWAAFGGDNGPDFAVSMGITTMDNAWNSHLCQVCMDYYRTRVRLTHDWKRFVLPFVSMAQDGHGSPLVPMRKDQMVGFILWPTQQFDIWIDDVRFEP
jgi:hypothetical protein